MNYLLNCEVFDARAASLKSTIEECEDLIARQRDSVEQSETYEMVWRNVHDQLLDNGSDFYSLLNIVTEKLTGNDDDYSVIGELSSQICQFADNCRARQEALKHRGLNQIAGYSATLALSRASLEAIQEPHSIAYSKAEINASLKDVPDVAPGSAFLYSDDDDDTYLCFRFNKLTARVMDKGPIYWVRPEGGTSDDDVFIEIDEIEVHINLASRKVQLKPARGDAHAPYEWGATHNVHPHILGNHEPCLGDFTEAVTTAIVERDFRTAALMLRSYLSAINSMDIAGRNWTRYFQQFGHNTADHPNMDHSQRGTFAHFFQQEDMSWKVRFSKNALEFVPIDE